MIPRKLRVVQPGERTSPEGKPVSNRILLALPDDEYRAIRPSLEFLAMPHHRGLYEPNRKIEYLHFPNRGLISLVIVMADGKTAEVAVLEGKESRAYPAFSDWTEARSARSFKSPETGSESKQARFGGFSVNRRPCRVWWPAMRLYWRCRFRRPLPATGCTTSSAAWRAGC